LTADLKGFDLLAGLSDPEKEVVADLIECLDLDRGEPLWREGQESDGLCLVQEGSLALSSRRAGDLGHVTAGSALGALSLVTTGPRELSAVAREDSRVWLLSREAFGRIVIDEPHVALRILEAAVLDFSGAVRIGLDQLANGVSPTSE
jgi:CRP-like cAMP-binding protein